MRAGGTPFPRGGCKANVPPANAISSARSARYAVEGNLVSTHPSAWGGCGGFHCLPAFTDATAHSPRARGARPTELQEPRERRRDSFSPSTRTSCSESTARMSFTAFFVFVQIPHETPDEQAKHPGLRNSGGPQGFTRYHPPVQHIESKGKDKRHFEDYFLSLNFVNV